MRGELRNSNRQSARDERKSLALFICGVEGTNLSRLPSMALCLGNPPPSGGEGGADGNDDEGDHDRRRVVHARERAG